MYTSTIPKIKIFVLLLLFSIGLIVTYIVTDTYFFSHHSHRLALERAQTKSLEREKRFQNFFETSEKTLLGIRKNGYFKRYLQGEAEKSYIVALFMSIAESQGDIMQLRYIDAEGAESVRIDRSVEKEVPFVVPDDQLQNKKQRYYFSESPLRPPERVWFSELDLNIEHGKVEVPHKPTLRAVLPLQVDGKFGGILIINYFMKQFLDALIQAPLYNMILVDTKGYPLVHYDAAKSWGRYQTPMYDIRSELPKDFGPILGQYTYGSERVWSQRLELPLPEPLVLVMQLNESNLSQQIAEEKNHYLYVVLMVLLFSLIASYAISRIVNRIGLDLDHTQRLEKLFRGIFEHAAVGIAQKKINGKWERVNGQLLEMLGYSYHELQRLSAGDITYAPDFERELELLEELKEGKRSSFQLEKRMIRKDGSMLPAKVTISLLRNDSGAADSVISIVEDLSEVEEHRRELRQAATVFENTAEGVMITDAGGTIINVNRAFETITGWGMEEAKGKTPSILKSGRHEREFYESMWWAIKEKGAWSGEVWNRRKNGEIYPQWLNINTVSNGEGEHENYIGVFADITALKASEKREDYLTNYDQLTGLPNRLLLQTHLEQSIELSKRHHTQTAVILLDIDNFKHINDSYGHSTGDALIIKIAERIGALLREEDTPARSGGDELVVVMGELHNMEPLMQTIRAIIDCFDRPFTINGKEFVVTASIGISIFPDDGINGETLMRNADAAMFDAKNDGKHTYKFYDDRLTAISFERVVLGNALKTALENGELELYYQPQFNLEDNSCMGFEALLRWNHPTLKRVTPDRFIPIAEETKLIIPIGEFVLQQACETVSRWASEALCNGRIAVNVSGVQMEYSDFAETLKRNIDRYKIPPHHLEIEVTESVIMKDPDRWAELLKRIKALGVSISIDDFGTGYSSLNYLRRLPLDTLKIDKSFVDDIPGEADACAIADTIINMAQSLGMTTLAEGVETEPQKRYLSDKGCTFMQGYLLGVPMSETEAYAWLRERREGGA